jgi:vacuolar-type H+-ATPase subunit F/Vma7
MDVAIVGDRYLTVLFRLLGIETVGVEDPDSAVAKVKQLVEAEDCKVLIITERVASRLKALMETLVKERKNYPVFLVIPDFEGVLGERMKELSQLVNRSVGVKLKTGD